MEAPPAPTDPSDPSTPRWPRLFRGAAGHAKFVYWTLLAIGIAALVGWIWGLFKSDAPSVPEQVRAIVRKEHVTRGGLLQSKQTFALHGDGTQSWVFVFAERATWRLVIYDIDRDRLRKGIEVTNRIRRCPVPADFKFEGVPYRRLDPKRKRLAREGWFGLYTPHVMFDKPAVLKIADDSRVLLVPISAVTPLPPSPNTVRATLVAVFWSADSDTYVVRHLYPILQRWTVRVPTPLRLELRQGAGFQTLPTATEVRIDTRKRLVFATVGAGVVQVHAFRLPLSPDDLEECPVLWRGVAPIGPERDVPRLERELSAGCPRV